MKPLTHDPRTWPRSGPWLEDSADVALARMPEFGRRFLEAAISDLPHNAKLCFLKTEKLPDVFVVVDLADGGAGFQIDPELEYIIVWDRNCRSGEYGPWPDQVPPALAYLHDILAACRS